ncbi:hypothetical protein [Actinomycetospora lemnae]|uniref:Uncharacterized protein n=1 Tax=Actinomycetospora lemnae TaxID=3019891 RepID=A0ABT5SV73_9PSEU|nr:hypothetical protein [Actinomycetospora sp. DW7H6]MDD7966763.1 hypothetical protein [Actinomycetospora sp. DW7H6]
MSSTVTAERPPDDVRTLQGLRGLVGLAALPSLRGMTPAEARAAQVLGMVWDPADVVELAIEWVGTGHDAPSLVDLAGRDWDDPDLPVLWDLVLDDLGARHPAPSTARRHVAAFLDRRRAALRRIPAARQGR